MFELELTLCIYIEVNHVVPELSGALVSVREGQDWTRGDHSCHQLLNGKPESELCSGLI